MDSLVTDIDTMSREPVTTERSRLVPAEDRSEAAPALALRILLLVDDETDHSAMVELLASIELLFDHQVDWVPSDETGLDTAAAQEHDVCLVDHRLGRRRGLQLVSEAGGSGSGTPIILLVDPDDEHIGVRAVEAGATGYLVKSRIDAETVGRSILRAVERAHLLKEVQKLTEAAESGTSARSWFLANCGDDRSRIGHWTNV